MKASVILPGLQRKVEVILIGYGELVLDATPKHMHAMLLSSARIVAKKARETFVRSLQNSL